MKRGFDTPVLYFVLCMVIYRCQVSSVRFMGRCTLMDHCDWKILKELMECANYIEKDHDFKYTIRHRTLSSSEASGTFKTTRTGSAEKRDDRTNDVKRNEADQHYCQAKFLTCPRCRLNVTFTFQTDESSSRSAEDTAKYLKAKCSTEYSIMIQDPKVNRMFIVNMTQPTVHYHTGSSLVLISIYYKEQVLHTGCTLTVVISSTESKQGPHRGLPLPTNYDRSIPRMEENNVLNNVMLVACLSGIGLIMVTSGIILYRIFMHANNSNNQSETTSPTSTNNDHEIHWDDNPDEWPTTEHPPAAREVVDLPPTYEELRKMESPPPNYVIAAMKLKQLSRVLKKSMYRLPSNSSDQIPRSGQAKLTGSLKLRNQSRSVPLLHPSFDGQRVVRLPDRSQKVSESKTSAANRCRGGDVEKPNQSGGSVSYDELHWRSVGKRSSTTTDYVVELTSELDSAEDAIDDKHRVRRSSSLSPTKRSRSYDCYDSPDELTSSSENDASINVELDRIGSSEGQSSGLAYRQHSSSNSSYSAVGYSSSNDADGRNGSEHDNDQRQDHRQH